MIIGLINYRLFIFLTIYYKFKELWFTFTQVKSNYNLVSFG
jgi:hypothetical protein